MFNLAQYPSPGSTGCLFSPMQFCQILINRQSEILRKSTKNPNECFTEFINIFFSSERSLQGYFMHRPELYLLASFPMLDHMDYFSLVHK